MTPVDIFIAYSHKDLAFKDELRVHLRPLTRAGRARVWDDHDIEAGREWDAAIKEKLFAAQIILLLVSPDSLDSDYFYGQEVAVSLERHARGEAVVVPVILRACLWHQTPLGALEALPTKGKPVSSWTVRDDAWLTVAQSVSELVDTRRAELERQTVLEQQRRAFAAAVEAASQLAQNHNWPEAARAYADALRLHQPDFSPDPAELQARIADCETQQQNALIQTKRAERKAVFDRALTRAGTLFGQENWREALDAYREALRLREPEFPLTEAGSRIETRIAQCEAQIKAAADRLRHYQHLLETAQKHLRRREFEPAEALAEEARQLNMGPGADGLLAQIRAAREQTAPPAAQGARRWPFVLGAALLCVALFLIFRPGKTARTGGQPADTSLRDNPPAPAAQTPSAAETADFNAAKTAGRLRPLEQFLNKYPDSRYKKEAQALLVPLYLRSAKTLFKEDKPEAKTTACGYVKAVLAIDPAQAEALDLQRRFKCQ